MNQSDTVASSPPTPVSSSRAESPLPMRRLSTGGTPAQPRSRQVDHARSPRDTELRNLAEQVPTAIHHLNPDGTIIWANPAELALLGYDQADYVGQPVAHFHDDPGVSARILACLRRGEAVRRQPARLRCRDGSFRDVMISSIDTGVPDRFCCMTVDRTGQQIATETTARLSAIVDSSNDAIIGKALDGTVTSWNRGAEELFGWRADEMVGRSISRIVPPDRAGELASILERLTRGERINHHETVRMRADGSLVDVSVSISPIYDDLGTIVGVAKIARDISERRSAEQRRQELLEVVAHDLRTPLTTVLGYAQLLQRRLGDDVALRAIAAQASQMGRLLSDVLETGRLESGRQYLRRTPVDLGELARASALQGSDLSGNPRIRVILPEEPVIGEWDSDRLSQILANLLDNATKYAPGSETVVEVSRQGDTARLTVRDHGPGIALTDRAHVFDRFYQGGTGQRSAVGVGLGLFISRALAEVHGGKLWFESEPGQGSLFTLSLPLSPAAEPGAAANETHPGPPQPGRTDQGPGTSR